MSDRGMRVAHRRGGNLRVAPASYKQYLETPGKVAVGEAVIGLEGEGAFEQWRRDARLLRHPALRWQCPQHEVVSVEIFRPLALDALDLDRLEARLDPADSAQGDL